MQGYTSRTLIDTDEDETRTFKFHGPPRKSFTIFIDKDTGQSYTATIDLGLGAISYRSQELGRETQPSSTPTDTAAAQKVAKESPEVQKRLKELGFNSTDKIVYDAWYECAFLEYANINILYANINIIYANTNIYALILFFYTLTYLLIYMLQ